MPEKWMEHLPPIVPAQPLPPRDQKVPTRNPVTGEVEMMNDAELTAAMSRAMTNALNKPDPEDEK